MDGYAGANKHVGPTFVVVFGPLQIVFTAILQLLIFDTPVSEGSYIGGALVSVGLFMLVTGRAVEESEVQKEQQAAELSDDVSEDSDDREQRRKQQQQQRSRKRGKKRRRL